MANQKGTEGTQRGNRQRFPYEPRVIGGKLLMPAELQAIHPSLRARNACPRKRLEEIGTVIENVCV